MDPMGQMFDAGMTPPENQILSESDFIATLANPDNVPICVQVPHDSSNADWNFNGQIVDVSLAASAKIKAIKALGLAEQPPAPLLRVPREALLGRHGQVVRRRAVALAGHLQSLRRAA